MWGAADYTYTLASGDFTSSTHTKTSGTITWTHAHGAGDESYGWDSTYGFKFGSGNKSFPTSFTLTSSSFSSKIKKVVVTASVNSGKTCKLDVKVGSTTYGSQATINTKNNDTFEFSIADASTVNGVVTLSFSSNTGPLYLKQIEVYYYEDVAATALAVKTAPTKTEYRVGEKIDFTGLVLNATIGGTPTDVTSGYTAKIGDDAVTSGTTVLSSVGKKTVTFTYGGKTTTQDIYVGELKGIAITTAPTKTTYDEGQSFNPAGMVVTATYTDSETTEHTWTQTVALKDGESDGYTYSPTTALAPANTSITVSYTWNAVEKTANQAITVTAGVPYTVTFSAGTGSCATASLDEASFGAGVTLPTATIGVTGWSFAGWATASTTNTEDEPTLYDAGDTYNPTDNCTLYAVYKFSEKSATTYKRATSVSDITSASSVVIVCNNQSKVLDNTLSSGVTAPAETSSKITAPEKAIFTLTGDNTDGYTLTNGTVTIGASSTSNSTLISNTTTNDLWVVKAHGTTNTFYFENKGADKLSLEYYNSSGYKWMVYAPTDPSANAAVAMKVYVPDEVTVYNSNPAAIVNPTIAWTTDGDKTLYLKNTNSYDNAANVTGISKTPVYTSSDATVATVSEAGVVEALKKGTTTIKATVEAETGVNTKAEVSYVVTVKDASNVAGIKAITSTASVVTFTADLTDAVVTYVNDSHAFIQDASGAVYASCGSSLTAGKKINGAVSGSVKAANQIDEITAIDLSDATVTDGVIPSAAVITAATLAANKADYEGKLVSIEGATVTANLTTGNASGGKISDDSKVTEINLYAPDSNIEALKDAEGTFNGYITLYSGSTVRLNIFEQSQITLTKNAPTDQPLAFASDAVELDEETDAYSAFTGQTVSGAVGDVTYSIDSDDDGVVTSIDDETGAVVLSGNLGTATIKATAAAKEVTVAGVTTPYTATTKTYTVTVYPRYTVTFNINGTADARRQATHDAEIVVPSPAAIGDYVFKGWSTTTVAATNVAPSTTSVTNAPTADATYYAVFARATGTPVVEHTSTFTIAQASAPSSPYVEDGTSWTWSNLTFTTTNNGACINKTDGSVTFTLPSGGKAKSLDITKTGNSWSGDASVVLKDASSNTVKTYTGSSLTFTFTEGTYDQSASYTLTNTTSKNAWVDHITFVYTTGGISYSAYCTTVPCGDVTMAVDKDSEDDYVYATFSSDEDVVFTSDVKVFALEVSGSSLVKNELTTGDFLITDESYESGVVEGGYYVPAGNGVLLRAVDVAKIAYYYPTTEQKAEDNPAVPSNKLIAGTGSTPVDSSNKYYKLTYENADKDNFGFYWGALDGGPFLLKKGKAYLRLPKPASARFFSLDDETTGINSMDNGQFSIDNEAVYDLQGRKVAQPTKGGLYIVNGKKVVLK